MPARIINNSALWLTLLFIALYWASELVVPQPIHIEIWNALRLGVSVVLLTVYAPNSLDALFAKHTTAKNQYATGQGILWLGLAGTSVWSAAGRFFGFSTALADSGTSMFLVSFVVLGGIHQIAAPGIQNGHIPERNWMILLLAGILGALMAGVALGFTWGQAVA